MAFFPIYSWLLLSFCSFRSPSLWFCNFSRVEGLFCATSSHLISDELFYNLVAQFVGVGMQPERNGCNYAKQQSPLPGVKRIYTPETQEIDEDMGAIPLSVVTHPQHIRGNHPLCSFTAVGPHAQELVAGQRPLHVFAPLEVLTTVQGWVLLMGVGLESMTLIHLAEQRAGRHLFRRWANGPDGRPMEVEVGGCSNGFEQLTPHLTSLEKRIQVGRSLWRAFSVQDTLEIIQKIILKNPSITHCSVEECGSCRDAIARGPLSTTSSLGNG